jgi:hypothetical protein
MLYITMFVQLDYTTGAADIWSRNTLATGTWS